MKTYNPAEAFTATMEAEMDRLATMVMSGSCTDYISYREMVACYKAMETAIEAAKKAFSGDEDEGD
jgi:hypothetical protein